METNKILIFYVEDPGAVNFILPVYKIAQRKKIKAHFYANGKANKLLDINNVDYEEFDHEKLNNIEPKKIYAIIIGTSQNKNSNSFKLIKYAKKQNILNIGFVDMAVDAHLRYSGNTSNPIYHIPDYIFVSDQRTKDYFIKLGVVSENVLITGNPAHDNVINKLKKLDESNLSKIKKKIYRTKISKPIIIFISESDTENEYNNVHINKDYKLFGRGKSTSRTKIVIEEFLDAMDTLQNDFFKVLRLHPKNEYTDLAEYYKEFDFISYQDNPLEYVWSSDLVVGMSSELLMEAVIMGKKTLSILPRELEKDWGPSTMNKYTPYVCFKNDIAPMLDNVLKSKVAKFNFKFRNIGENIIHKIQMLKNEKK